MSEAKELRRFVNSLGFEALLGDCISLTNGREEGFDGRDSLFFEFFTFFVFCFFSSFVSTFFFSPESFLGGDVLALFTVSEITDGTDSDASRFIFSLGGSDDG